MAAHRSPRGSADRNVATVARNRGLDHRSPRGSADRNDNSQAGVNQTPIAPRAGARIETVGRSRGTAPGGHRSPRGSAERNRLSMTGSDARGYRSPRGSADRNQSPVMPASRPRIAPRAGARIETYTAGRRQGCSRIAPRAGARIETYDITDLDAEVARSLPARERGSKQDREFERHAMVHRSPPGSADRNLSSSYLSGTSAGVAPGAGARIRTPSDEVLQPSQSPSRSSASSPIESDSRCIAAERLVEHLAWSSRDRDWSTTPPSPAPRIARRGVPGGVVARAMRRVVAAGAPSDRGSA